MTAPPLPFTAAESSAAHDDWNASCGHHSLAAACGVSLEAVRRALPVLTRGWMNPTMIGQTLTALRRGFSLQRQQFGTAPFEQRGPCIYRIQFEGSWLNPEVPATVAYRYTHYIAVKDGHVLDTALEVDPLWIPWNTWFPRASAEYPATVKRCTGWHFTHLWLLSK